MEHRDTKTLICFVNKMASTSKGHPRKVESLGQRITWEKWLLTHHSWALWILVRWRARVPACTSYGFPAPLLVSSYWTTLSVKSLPRQSLLSSPSLHGSQCDPLNGSTNALSGAGFLHLPSWTVELGGLPIGKHSWQLWTYQTVLHTLQASLSSGSSFFLLQITLLKLFGVPFSHSQGQSPQLALTLLPPHTFPYKSILLLLDTFPLTKR